MLAISCPLEWQHCKRLCAQCLLQHFVSRLLIATFHAPDAASPLLQGSSARVTTAKTHVWFAQIDANARSSRPTLQGRCASHWRMKYLGLLSEIMNEICTSHDDAYIGFSTICPDTFVCRS